MIMKGKLKKSVERMIRRNGFEDEKNMISNDPCKRRQFILAPLFILPCCPKGKEALVISLDNHQAVL